jgi:hypothetical protein
LLFALVFEFSVLFEQLLDFFFRHARSLPAFLPFFKRT